MPCLVILDPECHKTRNLLSVQMMPQVENSTLDLMLQEPHNSLFLTSLEAELAYTHTHTLTLCFRGGGGKTQPLFSCDVFTAMYLNVDKYKKVDEKYVQSQG